MILGFAGNTASANGFSEGDEWLCEYNGTHWGPTHPYVPCENESADWSSAHTLTVVAFIMPVIYMLLNRLLDYQAYNGGWNALRNDAVDGVTTAVETALGAGAVRAAIENHGHRLAELQDEVVHLRADLDAIVTD